VPNNLKLWPSKYTIQLASRLLNNATLEEVAYINYIGCDDTYNYNEGMNREVNTFPNIRGTISIILKTGIKNESNKFMVVLIVAYVSHSQIVKSRFWWENRHSEMTFLRL
jgi:hypothetical protein